MHRKYFKGYLQRAAAIGLAALLLTSCQPTPDTEAIVQKGDINKVVEKYADDENGADAVSDVTGSSGTAGADATGADASSDPTDKTSAGDKGASGVTGTDGASGTSGTAAAALRQSIGAPETASFTVPIANVGDGTTKVTADNVPIILPDVDKLGAATVVRSDLSAEQVQAIAEKFFDGRTAYEPWPDTKEDYMRQIESQQALYQDYLSQGLTEEELEGMQDMIDYLQAQMASAPAKADVVLEPITYEWKDFSGIPGLKSIAGNNDTDGVRYSISAQKEDAFCTLSLSRSDENRDTLNFLGKEQLAQMQQEIGTTTEKLEEIFSNSKCQYSEAEAVELCLEFLEDKGIDTTGLVVSERNPLVACDYQSGEIVGDGVGGYEIYMTHGVGGVAQTRTVNGIAYVPSEQNDGKVAYDYEYMIFWLNDTGVEDFYWQNPMAMGEVLADKVSLKPYEEIEEIICQHIGMAYENYRMDERLRNGESLDVDRITLGMMRIQNPDDEENYTLIPVWDVFSKQLGNYSLVTVNAMDGSIIIRENGY